MTNVEQVPIPCPFCDCNELMHGQSAEIGGFQIICSNPKCGARTGLFPTRPMARSAWNKRAVAQTTRDREQIAALLYVTRHPNSIWIHAPPFETGIAYKQADAILSLNTTTGKT